LHGPRHVEQDQQQVAAGDGSEDRGGQRQESGCRMERKPGPYKSASDCGLAPDEQLREEEIAANEPYRRPLASPSAAESHMSMIVGPAYGVAAAVDSISPKNEAIRTAR
jgi:hypothetical protein